MKSNVIQFPVAQPKSAPSDSPLFCALMKEIEWRVDAASRLACLSRDAAMIDALKDALSQCVNLIGDLDRKIDGLKAVKQ